MDWTKIIAEIIDAGYSQYDIAAAVGIKQPSVSSIATGKTKDPSCSVADAIRAMHKRAKRRKARHA
jgi:predicted XRE-type DNA-binding protein